MFTISYFLCEFIDLSDGVSLCEEFFPLAFYICICISVVCELYSISEFCIYSPEMVHLARIYNSKCHRLTRVTRRLEEDFHFLIFRYYILDNTSEICLRCEFCIIFHLFLSPFSCACCHCIPIDRSIFI